MRYTHIASSYDVNKGLLLQKHIEGGGPVQVLVFSQNLPVGNKKHYEKRNSGQQNSWTVYEVDTYWIKSSSLVISVLKILPHMK